MAGQLGEPRSGQLRHESAAAKGARIILAELKRLKWSEGDLARHPEAHARIIAMPTRLRRETTLSVREIADRIRL